MHQEDKNRLDKYLKGIASVDEQAKVEKMLASNEDACQVKEYVRKDWEEYSNEIGEKDLSVALGRVHHAIQLKENKLKQPMIRKIYRWYSAIAAIILIPLLIVGIISTFKLESLSRLLAEKATIVSIAAPSGARMSFQLPDGTEGVLNGNSSIEYPVPFTNHRDVKLLGEAYFNVQKDKNHPFTVRTNLVDVRVLGTKFNVNAYPDEKATEVILGEGKVTCRFPEKQGEVTLLPNDRIVITERNTLKDQVDAANYTAWREGKLIFRSESMVDVAHRISRWYGVEVEIADQELKTYSFRATFIDDSLEEVLKLLKMTSPIDYKIIQRKKLPDGSFSKKRVVFYNRY